MRPSRQHALQRAVGLFDPDPGLAPRRVTPGHRQFDELQGVLDRMDDASVAVVVPYQRRVPNVWPWMAEALGSRRHRAVLFSADARVAFDVILRDPAVGPACQRALDPVACRPAPDRPGDRRVVGRWPSP